MLELYSKLHGCCACFSFALSFWTYHCLIGTVTVFRVARQHCSLLNKPRSTPLMFNVPVSYASSITQVYTGLLKKRKCGHVCRPSSATGTRSASRNAVLHAPAAADPGPSNGPAAGAPGNAAMPAADEQQAQQHATLAVQTGRIRVDCSATRDYALGSAMV